ncbi:hypothetical protein [Dokdonella sp.]|uniref:hypothetical protein n=1 Tax=Dokdonella sp. TaxID=2291710 RepID=UPI003784B182
MTMLQRRHPIARTLFALVGIALAGAASAGDAPLPDLVLRDGFERPESADIRRLSDEFANAATLGDWRRLWREEYWLRDPLDALDIGATLDGWIMFVPATSTWYEDYVGELAFKTVAGDFVASTRVRARARDGAGAPGSTHGGSVGSEFSLAGILVRAPRADVACCDPSWWQAGGERYVFLSFGAADQPGSYQLEAKTTRAAVAPETHSVSNLELAGAQGDEAELRVARIGGAMLLLVREPGDAWRVQRRYRRDDLPLALQVGMTVYTDWAIASTYPYFEHNRTHIVHAWNDAGTPGDPDLRATFDWFRFARPLVPAALAGHDLADPGDVDDAALLAFLGDALP